MGLEQSYVNIYTAKQRVIKTLREHGQLNYSRLLMTTQLPEDVLETVLRLLDKERMVDRAGGEDDPVYRLATSWWGTKS